MLNIKISGTNHAEKMEYCVRPILWIIEIEKGKENYIKDAKNIFKKITEQSFPKEKMFFNVWQANRKTNRLD